jgi:spermidine synthase
MASNSNAKVIYQKRTAYSLLQVIEKKGYRYLVFIDPDQPVHLQKPESIYQGYMKLNNPFRTAVPFADCFHLAWIFNPKIKNILMIGLGAATVPKRFLIDYPAINFTTVEIDPVVVKTAHRYFFLAEDDPRHQIIIADGRHYIQNTSVKFDLVMLDAFFCQTIPFRLFTAEFFNEIKLCLTKEGVFSINFNATLTGPHSYLFRALYKTLAFVFPTIYIFARKKDRPKEWQHIKLFALTENLDLSPTEIFQLAKELAKDKVTIKNYDKKAQTLYNIPIIAADIPILSDTFIPAEILSLSYCPKRST